MAKTPSKEEKAFLREEKKQALKDLKRWFNANSSVEITDKTFNKIKNLVPFNPTLAIKLVAKDSGKDKRSINYLMGEGFKETYKLKPQIKNFIEQNLTKKQKKDVSLNPRDLSNIITKNYTLLRTRFENKFEKLARQVGHTRKESILKLNYEIHLMDAATFKKLKNEEKIKVFEKTKKEYEKYFKTDKAVKDFLDEYLDFGHPVSPDNNETLLEKLSWQEGLWGMDEEIFTLDNIEIHRDFDYNRNLTPKRIKNLLDAWDKREKQDQETRHFNNNVITKIANLKDLQAKNANKLKNLQQKLIISTNPVKVQMNAVKVGGNKLDLKSKNTIKKPKIHKPLKQKELKPMTVGRYEKTTPTRKTKIAKRIQKRHKK